MDGTINLAKLSTCKSLPVPHQCAIKSLNIPLYITGLEHVQISADFGWGAGKLLRNLHPELINKTLNELCLLRQQIPDLEPGYVKSRILILATPPAGGIKNKLFLA